MNKQNHTVTLPMQDYEELMQIKLEHSYMQTAIEQAILEGIAAKEISEGNSKNIRIYFAINALENAKQPF